MLRLRATAVALTLAALLSLSLGPAASTVQACPNCKTMMSGDETDPAVREAAEQQAALGRGMSYSVYLMLLVPYLLVGSFGGAVWWTMRQNARRNPPTV